MLTSDQEKWISHLSDKDKVTIVPWDSASPQIFEKVKKTIQDKFGEINVFHRGASSLGISGQDEIDVYIPVSPNRFNLLKNNFDSFLGEPRSIYPLQRIRYRIEQDGKHVDVFLINEEHSDWTNSLKFEERLRSNRQLLESYRILKEEGSGLTVREYYRRKLEFINGILFPKLKVAVIGGGVIGLYISFRLAQAGHKVSLFDKKQESDLGYKCCSALVSERIKQFIPITDDCIENVIDSCLIHFKRKDVRLNFSPKHLVLNRSKVINILLDLNRKYGVELFLGKEIKDIPQGFDRVIGCDGAMSMIRNSLHLKDPLMKVGIQVFLDKEDNSSTTKTFPTESGFCWQIPRGREIEIGALGDKKKVKQNLEEMFGIKDVKMFGALVPQPHFSLFNSGLIFPKEENITLCGDAMGLTKPWSGGGLIWGLYAAEMLVKTFPDFKEYKKQTEIFFSYKIRKGKIADKLVHLVGRTFPYIIPKEINYDNDFPSFLVAFRNKR